MQMQEEQDRFHRMTAEGEVLRGFHTFLPLFVLLLPFYPPSLSGGPLF